MENFAAFEDDVCFGPCTEGQENEILSKHYWP